MGRVVVLLRVDGKPANGGFRVLTPFGESACSSEIENGKGECTFPDYPIPTPMPYTVIVWADVRTEPKEIRRTVYIPPFGSVTVTAEFRSVKVVPKPKPKPATTPLKEVKVPRVEIIPHVDISVSLEPETTSRVVYDKIWYRPIPITVHYTVKNNSKYSTWIEYEVYADGERLTRDKKFFRPFTSHRGKVRVSAGRVERGKPIIKTVRIRARVTYVGERGKVIKKWRGGTAEASCVLRWEVKAKPVTPTPTPKPVVRRPRELRPKPVRPPVKAPPVAVTVPRREGKVEEGYAEIYGTVKGYVVMKERAKPLVGARIVVEPIIPEHMKRLFPKITKVETRTDSKGNYRVKLRVLPRPHRTPISLSVYHPNIVPDGKYTESFSVGDGERKRNDIYVQVKAVVPPPKPRPPKVVSPPVIPPKLPKVVPKPVVPPITRPPVRPIVRPPVVPKPVTTPLRPPKVPIPEKVPVRVPPPKVEEKVEIDPRLIGGIAGAIAVGGLIYALSKK